jgi:NADPH2:quinone reductase
MLAIATINHQLTLIEHLMPQSAAGQILVKVAAAGVNRADLMQAQGKYPPPAGESEILGLEVAGTIAALGEGVTGWQVGDAVLALVGGGAYAEYCLVEQSLCCLQPDTLSYAAAASLPEVWMTAWLNLIYIGQLKAGQRVLIHAGASGVGAAAIQLAKSVGAWVAVTTSTPEKQAFCRELGADLVIDYRTQDFATEIKAAGGVDLILDTVGGDYLAGNQRCLNRDGLIVVIGLLGGIEAQLNLGLMLVKRQRIQGSALRSQPLAVKSKLTEALRNEVLPRIASGEFKVTLDRTFAMADAQAAHDYVAANRNSGKVVLLNAAN